MPEDTHQTRKDVLINLYLFFAFYLALIAIEKQLLRTDLSPINLGIKPGSLAILGGFVAGSLIVIGLTYILSAKQIYLRLVIVGLLLIGAILGNRQISLKIFYPPFDRLPAGNLQKLGQKNWQHDLPYSVLASAFESYYLKTVLINPALTELEEYSRVYRFGVNLETSSLAPVTLSDAELALLDERYPSACRVIKDNEMEYRLCDPGSDQELFLIPSGDLLLFIPAGWIQEAK